LLSVTAHSGDDTCSTLTKTDTKGLYNFFVCQTSMQVHLQETDRLCVE